MNRRVVILLGIVCFCVVDAGADEQPTVETRYDIKHKVHVADAIKVAQSREVLIDLCITCLRARRTENSTEDDALSAVNVLQLLGANDPDCIRELALHMTLHSKVASSSDALDGFSAAKSLVAVGNKVVIKQLLERLHSDSVSKNELKIIAHVLSRIDSDENLILRFNTAIKEAKNDRLETAKIFQGNVAEIKGLLESSGFPSARESWPVPNSNR